MTLSKDSSNIYLNPDHPVQVLESGEEIKLDPLFRKFKSGKIKVINIPVENELDLSLVEYEVERS